MAMAVQSLLNVQCVLGLADEAKKSHEHESTFETATRAKGYKLRQIAGKNVKANEG